ncbi:DNA topoisomerase IV subunit A [Candidatus Mycoplasma pogonae]
MAQDHSKFLLKSLDTIMADRFGRYSKYIIQQRALPDARDGLKPVQRRILYSMWELGLKADKPFKKSARVVGDVIGKYHPHGDSSIYESMVRMAQEWKMNVPLINMHGNKGSIDDDPAAAMRYTEVRLEKISNLMLEGIDKNLITFAPNFDDSEKEPTVLPALIPNLLLNGSRGIASGFATEIPPHNLKEILDGAIAKIKTPEISLSKLQKMILGPDFPTGGIIYGTKGIDDAFQSGNGRITLASKYEIKITKNKTSIEITEIPYGVIKAKLVRDIAEIAFEKKVPGIKEVIDQSSREGLLISIELEADANSELVVNYLLQKTDLQVYYSYNVIAIQDYAPKLMTLDNLLTAYINHIKQVKKNELIYDLAKWENKLEIVEGLIRVAEITDQVIAVIRNSDNSKKGVVEELEKQFNFTHVQAVAIAELRLYRLSRVDQEMYINEANDLSEKITKNKFLLNSETAFNDYLVEILKTIQKEYGEERKTQIIDQDKKISIDAEDLIKNETVYIGISQDGYIKRFSPKVFDSNELNTYGLKEQDRLITLQPLSTLTKLLVFNSSGTYSLINVHKIPETKWKDMGIHINDFTPLMPNAQIVDVIAVNNFDINAYVTLVTAKGLAKRVKLDNFETTRTSKTLTAIKLKNDDKLAAVKVSNGYKDIVILTQKGKALRYSELEIPIYGSNSSGAKAVSLAGDDVVQHLVLGSKQDVLLLGTDLAKFKKMNLEHIPYSSKGTQGKNIYPINKAHPLTVSLFAKINKTDVIYCYNNNQLLGEVEVKNIAYSKLEDNFSKVKITNTNKIFLNEIFTIDVDSDDWQVVEKQEEAEIMDLSDNVINQKFEEVEEKIKALDDLNIDDLLKKIK